MEIEYSIFCDEFTDSNANVSFGVNICYVPDTFLQNYPSPGDPFAQAEEPDIMVIDVEPSEDLAEEDLNYFLSHKEEIIQHYNQFSERQRILKAVQDSFDLDEDLNNILDEDYYVSLT